MATDVPVGFSEFSFAEFGIQHRVFCTKPAGPPVLVMHELPGLSPAALDFGRRLADEQFTVYMPLLFGSPAQDDWRSNQKSLCVSREFANLEAGVSAPIVDWLRALALDISRRHDSAKVGAIGMCLTGAFAIPLILERCVAAPIAAQPGVPHSAWFVATGWGKGPWMAQLNISDTDLTQAAMRAQRDGVSLMAIRFAEDRICPKERIDRIQEMFGASLIRREVPGKSLIPPPPHATLTSCYKEDADHPTRRLFEEVVEFLRQRLVTNHEGPTTPVARTEKNTEAG